MKTKKVVSTENPKDIVGDTSHEIGEKIGQEQAFDYVRSIGYAEAWTLAGQIAYENAGNDPQCLPEEEYKYAHELEKSGSLPGFRLKDYTLGWVQAARKRCDEMEAVIEDALEEAGFI